MRFFIPILAIALAICPTVNANDVDIAKARARAALDLMQRDRERAEVHVAKTVAAFELKKLAKDRECMEDVQSAVERSAREGKLLVIWVGFSCKAEPEIRAAFPDAIHCHADTANGDGTQRILLGNPPATLHRFDRAGFTKATPAEMRKAANRPAPAPTKEVSQAASFFDPFSSTNRRLYVAPDASPFAVQLDGGCADGQCGVPSASKR